MLEIAGDVSDQFPAEYAGLFPEPVRLVCAPMAAAGWAVGVMLADRLLPAAELSDADRYLLWTLGKAAALASVARIVATQAETARKLEHRIDLAREIHEGVIQRLFGVSMALDGEGDLPSRRAQALCVGDPGRAGRPARGAAAAAGPRAARDADDVHARRSSGSRGCTRSWASRSAREPATRSPTALEPLAQSVLAEAVRNAHKHANPTKVEVRVSRHDGAFVLEVSNDGVNGRQRRPGMGLRLAALEALQQRRRDRVRRAGAGHVEGSPRRPARWLTRPAAPSACACSSSTITMSCTGAFG